MKTFDFDSYKGFIKLKTMSKRKKLNLKLTFDFTFPPKRMFFF